MSLVSQLEFMKIRVSFSQILVIGSVRIDNTTTSVSKKKNRKKHVRQKFLFYHFNHIFKLEVTLHL